MSQSDEIEQLKERNVFLLAMTRDAQDAASAYGKTMLQFAKDAARYRWLRELPVARAQAYFWTYPSRSKRDKAIDAAIAAADRVPLADAQINQGTP